MVIRGSLFHHMHLVFSHVAAGQRICFTHMSLGGAQRRGNQGYLRHSHNAGAISGTQPSVAFLRLPPGARKAAASASVGHAQITRRAMWMALKVSWLFRCDAGQWRGEMLCHRGSLQQIPLIQRAPERQPRLVGISDDRGSKCGWWGTSDCHGTVSQMVGGRPSLHCMHIAFCCHYGAGGIVPHACHCGERSDVAIGLFAVAPPEPGITLFNRWPGGGQRRSDVIELP